MARTKTAKKTPRLGKMKAYTWISKDAQKAIEASRKEWNRDAAKPYSYCAFLAYILESYAESVKVA